MYSILQYTCMYVCTPRRCPTPTPPVTDGGGGGVQLLSPPPMLTCDHPALGVRRRISHTTLVPLFSFHFYLSSPIE